MFADYSTEIMLFLALAAFVAGFVDSIAGGGGLIGVPVLLLAGLSPLEALGTNKLQGLFGTGSATLAYARKGHVDLRAQAPAAIASFLGAIAGAFFASWLPGDWLSMLLPVLLIAIAVYFALKRDLDDQDRVARLAPFAFMTGIVPLIGFYDGMFGPGAGSLYMVAFVTLAGYGALKATAHTKLLNFASNLGGFAGFAAVGAVVWPVGLAMGICSFLGARLGAALAMRRGAAIIRPLLIATSIAMALRLLVD